MIEISFARTVRFSEQMPSEFQGRARQLLDQCEILVPPYVDSIYFDWSPASENGMECDHSQEYRHMTICVTGRTFEPGEDPLRFMLHEIAHWYNAPIRDAGKKAISQIVDAESSEAKIAGVHIDHVMEACNSDLEQVFMRLLGRP